jgi:hypothetical protein
MAADARALLSGIAGESPDECSPGMEFVISVRLTAVPHNVFVA